MEKRTTGHILRLNLAAELTHGMCVSNLAFQVACEMGLPPETCHEMAVAGMVHDIGKLEIAKERINHVEDVLTLGDIVKVVCLGKDKMGRMSFSIKDVKEN